jgi:excisionase family DNA binding protein
MGHHPQEDDAMPRTTKPPTKPKPEANAPGPGPHPEEAPAGEVLTLADAAAYLRTSEEEVLSLLRSRGLPGRAVGDGWRFLKTAIQDWLRAPITKPSKEAMLSVIGAWKDDPYLDEMLKEIYKNRGRPMTEDG